MRNICICVWSGPRNVSTALMYSFRERSDTEVVDEPLYGHYLRVSGAQHPGRQDVLADMDLDGNRVMGNLLQSAGKPVLFLKHMAHHLVGIDLGFLEQTRNVLLVRDPGQMLPSLAQQLPDPQLRDTALAQQRELFDYLSERGQTPPVLDARELLLDPAGMLEQLCGRLGIGFQPAMLSWEPGAKPEDGIWARHWYTNVHRSTGFQPYREKKEAFPERLRPLLEECRPHYEYLLANAIRASS